MLLTTVPGGVVGLLAGYFPRIDSFIMRLANATMALPAIVLALAIVSILKPSEACAIVAIGVVCTSRTAWIV